MIKVKMFTVVLALLTSCSVSKIYNSTCLQKGVYIAEGEDYRKELTIRDDGTFRFVDVLKGYSNNTCDGSYTLDENRGKIVLYCDSITDIAAKLSSNYMTKRRWIGTFKTCEDIKLEDVVLTRVE